LNGFARVWKADAFWENGTPIFMMVMMGKGEKGGKGWKGSQ